MENPLKFLNTAEIQAPSLRVRSRGEETTEPLLESKIDMENLPDGVISSNLLLDLSAVKDATVRSGLSLSTLFANRYATKRVGVADADLWLAEYQNALSKLGFGLTGTARASSKFERIGVTVHEALIPFLTIALGGAAVGPVIMAALENLQKMEKDSPWITLFERESKRVEIHEMHFAAALSGVAQTEIRYAVARLNLKKSMTQVLFFKITKDTAAYESMTTSMTANNSLLAIYEDDLKRRLSGHIGEFIWDPNIEL